MVDDDIKKDARIWKQKQDAQKEADKQNGIVDPPPPPPPEQHNDTRNK